MPDITANLGLIFERLNVAENFTFTNSGATDHHSGTQTASTSAAVLTKGSVGTIGMAFIMNLDTSVDVEVSLDGGTNYDITLDPETFNIVSPDADVYVRTASGTAEVFYALIEE